MARALTFYTHPQSRGRIVRWLLEELGQPYETRAMAYGAPMKAAEYLAINPMGKVPAVQHGGRLPFSRAFACARRAGTGALLSLDVLRIRPA